jgi:DNA invertase Pin-like site-specific DNA recombinase
MCRQARHALPGTLVRHHRSFRVNQVLRPGFARLVAEITMGHVELVLGLEMSRLARAGQDWYQLIELCSLAGALLADADGVYDPNWYNELRAALRTITSHVDDYASRARLLCAA